MRQLLSAGRCIEKGNLEHSTPPRMLLQACYSLQALVPTQNLPEAQNPVGLAQDFLLTGAKALSLAVPSLEAHCSQAFLVRHLCDVGGARSSDMLRLADTAREVRGRYTLSHSHQHKCRSERLTE